MSKWMYVLGAVLVAGFAVLGMVEMIKAQTPYVTTVSEVRATHDRPVQFIGSIVHDESHYDESADELIFRLRDDKGDSIDVSYKGVKPANFDSSEKAVVRGTCIGKTLVADQVLLKCPSKYKASKTK